MSDFLQDLRYAIRVIKKTPGLTIVIVLTLAIGIGGTTSVFTVVSAVLLRPLPYPDSDRLVKVVRNFPDQPVETTSATQFLFWRRYSSSFTGLAAYDVVGSGINLTNVAEPERVRNIRVSADFFKALQVYPVMGRDFTAEDDLPNSAPVVILSNDLWRRRFNADRDLVGKAITLSGESYTVVGVMPPDFTFSPSADLWTPLRAEVDPTDQTNLYEVIGRLKPAVTLRQAQSDLIYVAEQFRKQYPNLINENEGILVRSYHSSLVGNVRTSLVILFAVVCFVLLIACFNIANLLLARSNSRRKEMALRIAMGARAGRIIRQLLTESALLSVIGGSFGVLLSFVGLPLLLSLSPGNLPLLSEVGIDSTVLLFTLGVTLLSSVVFGLAPAVVAARVDINRLLQEGGRSIAGHGKRIFQNGLVVTQLSLSLVLITGAALLIESYVRLNRIDPGVDPEGVLTMQMSLTGSRYNSTPQMTALYEQVSTRLEALPGVQAAATVTNLPMEKGPGFPFEIVGDPNEAGDTAGDTQWRAITPRYFEVMRIPLLRGRAFDNSDSADGAPVTIINEALARQYWYNRNPIDESILIGNMMGPRFKDVPRRVVGVVGNVREMGLESDPPPTIFVPATQIPDAYTQLVNSVVPLSWIIRTNAKPASLINAVRREMLGVNTGQPVTNFRPMEEVLAKTIARQQFNMLHLSIFAALALLLSAVGLYSLMSFLVTERAQEIGIRIALGAQPKSLFALILANALKLIMGGMVIGLVAVFALTRVMTNLLFETSTTDPLALLIVSLVLVLVAVLASYIPARRASRVDPLIALRRQ